MSGKGVDLALVFGGGAGKGPRRPAREPDDAEESSEPDVPGDVAAAYNEYEANKSAKTLWEFVRMCLDHQGDGESSDDSRGDPGSYG